MKNSPFVSICIPAYNARRFLGETLSTVRDQSHKDWELIVVEDGSDDGTAGMVAEFAQSVSQPVRYERHIRNQGLPATRNTGFGLARADWIAILDADDLWTPEHLEKIIQTQADSAARLVFSAAQIFDSDTGEFGELRKRTPEQVAAPASALFRGELIIQPSSVLFDRKLFMEYGGFNADFPICNDLEFWLRLATSNVCFAYSARASCLYRKHPEAMSRKSAHLIAEVGRVRRTYAKLVPLSNAQARRLGAEAFWNAARIVRATEPKQAMTWAWQGLRTRFLG